MRVMRQATIATVTRVIRTQSSQTGYDSHENRTEND